MKRLDCRHAKKIAHKSARFVCWVKTSVEIFGLEHIKYLPIMDYKNKAIRLGNITSFDVNNRIFCSRFGISAKENQRVKRSADKNQ